MNRGRTAARGVRRGATRAGSQRASTEGASEAGNLSSGGAAPESAGSTPRGGATARATRAPSAGRFRPKAVRRDEADRDLLARQEEQKASERAAEERRARGRSFYRSKRSRGDAMGSRGGWGRGIPAASGPFSGGFGGASGRSGFGGGGPGGGPYGGGGGRSLKSEGKGFSQADASRMRETRINADRLHVMTPAEELDSDDEAMITALSNRTATALPMGIYRREHKETGIVVATTAELEAAEKANGEEESLWVDGEESAAPNVQPQEQGVWNTKADEKVLIKKEPGADDTMDLDTEVKPAPELEKKPILTKPKKEPALDSEEKIIQGDLQLLASELGAVTITEDGETKSEGPANKDGRMYLFQFPPLIPPLKKTGTPKPRVKSESDAFTATGHNTTSVDLTDSPAEDDEDDEEDETTGGFRSQPLREGGMIGKLNVRRSGKVELDWGGTTLEMSPAAGMNFLTTAVIVEENDQKAQNGVIGGESVGMGKIMGRFILAPIWSEEKEWNVAPHELTT
ncbi:hypothetical protein HIM_00390 [Hirsutella minnesotensis 3608]|nr:hypothetical protein HIM_00390 [Hirsutella minnesotensis 3608]